MTHPDYERIAELERELGMTNLHKHSLYRERTVCLTKRCDGETEEVQSWEGLKLMRLHHCR